MDCSSCSKGPEAVPYIAYEGAMARMERTVRRLWILAILLVVLLVGSNLAWIVYESQFEDVTVSQDVDTGEGDAIVAGYGDVYYGEDQADGSRP